jgi:ADP-heptose:LPS heptosyltransferase/Flp pilus assembly protein TadD
LVREILANLVRRRRNIIQVADAAREAKKYREAALLYEKALDRTPNDAAIHTQCGHMLKEAGDLARAEQHYHRARQLTPNDPDLALQLGHFYKVAGRPAEAQTSYRRAMDLSPGWPEPAIQLAELDRVSDRNHSNGETVHRGDPDISPNVIGDGPERADGRNQGLIQLANAARDAKEYRKAALLYEKALDWAPNDAAIHIQCGHVFKEAGDLTRAEQHYQQAQQLTPYDPDLALQFGHFYKVAGRLAEAETAYKRAAELDRNWAEPARWLGELYRSGWRSHNAEGAERPSGLNGHVEPEPLDFAGTKEGWKRLHFDEGLIPELVPRAPESFLHAHSEEIQVRALGRQERTRWGILDTLRGADAIRGFCVSAIPIVELRATLNGLRFCITSLEGYPLKYEGVDPRKKKYVFNIWYDFSNFVDGSYNLELQFVDEQQGIRLHREQIVIAPPLSEHEYPDSDRLVSVSATDTRSPEEQINSRPSMIRPARYTRFETPPRNVLIQRVDQLGDLILSIPALRLLRELLPEARLVGLLSFANADLARSLDLFNEVITIDFRNDEKEWRRVMPPDKQEELRRRLEPYKFDVAIDLVEAPASRPLLLLSGAPFLIGFSEGRFPWLSASYEAYTPDPLDNMEEVCHSAKAVGLVRWFGILLGTHSQIVRRADLTRDRLASPPYGLAANDRFALLHTGARLKFSRWPHYDALAAMILDKTDLKVMMLSDEPRKRSTLPRALAASERFLLLDRRLAFDDFDALLSFCTVFVGNDSGPGHLAALRGANVINLFMARHNWNDWGHQNRGYIISRRVPCAGCDLHYDPEECGKGFACVVNISVEEVFRTAIKFV